MKITEDFLQFLKKYVREKAEKKEKGEIFSVLDLFALSEEKNFSAFDFSATEIAKLTQSFGRENADIVENVGKKQRGRIRCTYYRRI